MDVTDFLRHQVISLAYQQLSATELMTRAAAGDVEAYIALVCLKYPVVASISRNVLGPVAGVEDVAQEVFVQLWRQRENIRAVDAIDGWLAKTARNLALKLASRESQQKALGAEWWQRHGLSTASASPEAAAVGGEIERRLRQLIATRPGHERQVLLAAEHAEDDAQAAASLGLSVNTYRVRLHRARQKVRRLLVKAGVLPALVVGATVGGARRAGAIGATLWSRRLGKLFLLTSVIAAGVTGGVIWQAPRIGPVAERDSATILVGGAVETLQSRNLRVTRDEIAGPVRDLFQKFYPPPHVVEVADVRAFGSEVEVELRVTPPPPAVTGLAAVTRGRYCVFRRRLTVSSQPTGETRWYSMNSERPIELTIPNPFGASFSRVIGREEFAAAVGLFDQHLPKDDRSEQELLRMLFGPPDGELLLPTENRGVSGFPGGLCLVAGNSGMYVRDGAGTWRYVGECPGWFPVVADGQVYCDSANVIWTRPLDKPSAPWVKWCEGPALEPGEQTHGPLFVTGGRLCMSMAPHSHRSRPLNDPRIGWTRTDHALRHEGVATAVDVLFGNDGKQLFKRPATQLDAAWVPVGPWPDVCTRLVVDGDRLLAFGWEPGPIHARTIRAALTDAWVVVGHVHDPYKR